MGYCDDDQKIWQGVEKYENSHIFPYNRLSACNYYDYLLCM